ncbi:MAG: hypothetical protein AB3N11_11545, partial [Arenibacterium sp.]
AAEEDGTDEPLQDSGETDALQSNTPEQPTIEPPAQPVDMRTATLSEKIQALEAAIAQTEDQWEPDGNAEDTDYAARRVKTIPWEDAAEDESRDLPPTAPDVTEAEVAAPVDASAETEQTEDETAILDEETLRILVSDIVREELQGALGERITRNVRKLVRREIHRALTTKELE